MTNLPTDPNITHPQTSGMPRTASTASMGSAGGNTTASNKDDDELVLLSPKPHLNHNNPSAAGGGAPASSIAVQQGGKEEEQPPQVSSRRIWGLSRPEAKWVVLAVVMAVVNGCTFPAVRFAWVCV